MDKWYRLDNAAKIFPAVTQDSNSSIYRISMELKSEVNPALLQQAVDLAFQRYPSLRVKIRRGVFWNFFDQNESSLPIHAETTFPCSPLNPRENNGYFLRVLYYRSMISVEMFHSLTDGMGAMEFLKTIVYQYLLLTGKKIRDEGLVLRPDDPPNNYESEDSFPRYYHPVKAVKQKQPQAFHLTGTPFEPFGNNVVTGDMSAAKIHAAAKRRGATITEYLAAVLIQSISQSTMQYGYGLFERPITVSIPMNLRTLFPSKTLRNFFAVANVCAYMKDGLSFDDIVKIVQAELAKKCAKPHLEELIAENIKLERNLAIKVIPLFLKKLILRGAFNFRGENLKTITISNLGRQKLPPDMAQEVVRSQAILYPTAKSPVNCGISTLGDVLSFSFTRTITENDLIRRFFVFLVEDAETELTIYSNNWGYPHDSM